MVVVSIAAAVADMSILSNKGVRDQRATNEIRATDVRYKQTLGMGGKGEARVSRRDHIEHVVAKIDIKIENN
jgi:hypothetical protein